MSVWIKNCFNMRFLPLLSIGVMNTIFLAVLLFLMIKESSSPPRGAVLGQVSGLRKASGFLRQFLNEGSWQYINLPSGWQGEANWMTELCKKRKNFSEKGKLGWAHNVPVSLKFINFNTIQFSPHRKTSHHLSPLCLIHNWAIGFHGGLAIHVTV